MKLKPGSGAPRPRLGKRPQSADYRIWDAYAAWLAATGFRPGDGILLTEAFRAGYLAAESAAEARRTQEHAELMP